MATVPSHKRLVRLVRVNSVVVFSGMEARIGLWWIFVLKQNGRSLFLPLFPFLIIQNLLSSKDSPGLLPQRDGEMKRIQMKERGDTEREVGD